jgi:hypothetical protein
VYSAFYNDHSVIAVREVIGIYSANRSKHTKTLGLKRLIKKFLKRMTRLQIICASNVMHRIYGGLYRGAVQLLARPTSRCILFDGENVSFDASVVIYINSINIPQL